ncbi:Adipose-regulatory protein, Seipin [Corchorus capsularis]|uniref:Adipose-regulatory protein, Seipin n=1 Tax=Corchorus capsularis TaxID=210143 RepID=A0A1R3IUX2_COCAP|nr:Adipose-regulatory protein, Seipin [Corchorus capsularis]
MESQSTDEDGQFLDALDDFPFYDCLSFDQSEPSTSDSPSTLRRRTFSRRETSSKEPGDSVLEASTLESHSITNSREPRYKLYRDLKANDNTFELAESTRDGLNPTRVPEEKSDVESTVTTAKIDEPFDRVRDSADSGTELSESLSPSLRLLLFIADLVIRAVGFQLNLVTVSLTLPESEYNRNLGMFQVRVDFLSFDGITLASSSHPCMLKFKSEPIRLLLTFFKAAPLITGYASEAQTLNLKIRGLHEGTVPTACLRVVLEQRAEFRPGAGIPELYDASVILESELPFLKRIIWSWRRTIFIWISMATFMMELLFTLVCCRPIIIPRTRARDGSFSSRSAHNS